MQKFSRLITIAGLTALIGAVQPVWAESAPVFDVDNYGQDAEQSQDLPMPPPPGEEAGAKATTHQVAPTAQTEQQAGTFVPVDGSNAPAQVQQAEAQTPDQAQNPAPPVVVQSAPAPAKSTAAQSGSAQQQVASDETAKSAGMSVSTEHLTPEQRMRRLEQQLNNLQNNGSPSQVEALQSEVQSLRGQVEQLNHQLEKVKTADKTPAANPKPANTQVASAAGADADPEVSPDDQPAPAKKKATKTTVSDNSSKTVAGDVTKGQPDVAEEQKAYQTAYDLIKAKKYPEAVTTLQGMLKKYPSGQFASNAHYWLGELYGLMGKHDEALNEFSTVIEKFPGSPRVSDAELKVGLILAAQSKWADAKKAFNRIINTYPGTASSRLASEQLKQIKLAGH